MNDNRARIMVRGAVQGVGFRPFVFRLAKELGLAGCVSNSSQGVLIEVEGEGDKIRQFRERLETDKPHAAVIQAVEFVVLEALGLEQFAIVDSHVGGAKTALILPDLATCDECLKEIFDPASRRYLYPFTNCTHCGPRFSIIEGLPYDRINTAMRRFAMCPDCHREYHDPSDRRFHAQPIACPKCGPHIELWNGAGQTLCKDGEALLAGVRAVREGKILAMKGIGGFQLIVDAGNDCAVRTLRQRKHRPDKPFAVLFGSLDSVRQCCHVSEVEARLLTSTAAPIVLLERLRNFTGISPSVAPANPNLGAMLAYSPLHHLLMRMLDSPVVATSGNLSDEPICTDEYEALERLKYIADIYLVHDRPIVRHMDDSIVRVIQGREMVLRVARGYAPQSIGLQSMAKAALPVLAVGAHMKNTVALGFAEQMVSSQHIGDLETEQAFKAFEKATSDLPRLYEVVPHTIACDLHPEYVSTRFAHDCELKEAVSCVKVQHHYAHILSCMAENEVEPPVLGICWDGTGYGVDDTIWGGEFLAINDDSFKRVAHLRQFRLPGGDAVAREPRRSAVGLVYELWGDSVFGRFSFPEFSSGELRMLKRMLASGVNSPVTSSAGRFFDAVASLVGLRHRTSFEGEAAMMLEFAIKPEVEASYRFDLLEQQPVIIDWEKTVLELLGDLRRVEVGAIAAKFHNTLVEMMVSVVQGLNIEKVVLAGGCFQNKYLIKRAIVRLQQDGFRVFWPRRVPPNDGGIALGQIVAALRARQLELRTTKEVCA